MLKIFAFLADIRRIDRAFVAAADRRNGEALSILESLVTDRARNDFDVTMLRGALLSIVGRHKEALSSLVSAAQRVKRSKKLTNVEIEYLTAYLLQYWEQSAEQLGVKNVTTSERDALHIEGPIILSSVRNRLKKSFPLTAKFTGIQVLN
jgi:hypothetical protein